MHSIFKSLPFLQVVFLLLQVFNVSAEPLKIGFIGSLSSFAANYGTQVLEGARTAIEELNKGGDTIELIVEDDQSIAKNTVSAYQKLKSIDGINAIIGGSWWVNAIAKQAERDGIILLSCETLFNKDVVVAESYFILPGDLRSWIKVFVPIIERRGWQRAAMVRYASGFGMTLEEEWRKLFSESPRKMIGTIEYSDIQIPDAGIIAMQLKRLNPDVIYIDAQPSGLANLLRKLVEVQATTFTILTNAIADDVMKDDLFDLSQIPSLYFSRRAAFDSDFSERFRRFTGNEPRLNADLGYYSIFLLSKALRSESPVQFLKSGVEVTGKQFTFDKNNVERGIAQEVYVIEDNRARKVSL